MTSIGENLTVGWVIDDGGRRSATRSLDLNLARAIARGRMPYLACDIEATLTAELGVSSDDPDIEITWASLTGQPPGMIERLPWYPGTPLPDQTLLVSCTVSAPLQD